MEKEVLHSNDWFNVIKMDGRVGTESNSLSVVILPYTSVRGLPATVGVVDEKNPFREGGKSKTLVTGSSKEEDPDILSTAQRKLKEESGYDVLDPDRWTFLGFLTTSKHSSGSHPCFACDVTGLDCAVTEGEEKAFSMVPVKDALDSDDCFIPALFMKVFRYIFGFTGAQQQEEEQKTKTTAKQPIPADIKEEILKIDGVNGVGVGTDNVAVVYTKTEPSKQATEKLDSIFADLKQEYKVEVVGEITGH